MQKIIIVKIFFQFSKKSSQRPSIRRVIVRLDEKTIWEIRDIHSGNAAYRDLTTSGNYPWRGSSRLSVLQHIPEFLFSVFQKPQILFRWFLADSDNKVDEGFLFALMDHIQAI